MNFKRTNLHKAEAEYLFAQVLLEVNKYDSFIELSIPERNNLIDKICSELIKEANNDETEIKAVEEEIFAYKLSPEEESKFYNQEFYISDLKRPANFEKQLENKYRNLIKRVVYEKLADNFN